MRSGELKYMEKRERNEFGQGIYIVTTEDGFPCKVGVTNKLRERVGQIQTGNWNKLKASWFSFVLNEDWRAGRLSIWAAFNTAAPRLERAVHRTLRELDLGLEGEWFAISDEDCRKVIAKVAEETGLRLAGIEILEGIEMYRRASNRQIEVFKAIVEAEVQARAAVDTNA